MRRVIRLMMVAAAAIASLVAYFNMPERVPVHWNLRGEVDRYGSHWEALLVMPVVMLALWGLFRVLPKIDPLRANYAKFTGTYETMIDAVLALMLAFHIAVVLGAWGAPDSVTVLVRAAVGVMFIILGNVMPRTRRNWFVGVRTPWTLASDRVWEKTHRLAGYLFVGAGILVLATVPLDPRFGIPVLVAAVVIAAFGSLIYSYLEWRKEQAGSSTG